MGKEESEVGAALKTDEKKVDLKRKLRTNWKAAMGMPLKQQKRVKSMHLRY